MGGRGASAGISKRGKPYGTEHYTVYQYENIKFIKNAENNSKVPMETMTQGRIYAIINKRNEVHSISFYDENNKRYKQIDVRGTPHDVKGKKMIPHTHYGYEHDEGGTKAPNIEERQMVARVLKIWDNRHK